MPETEPEDRRPEPGRAVLRLPEQPRLPRVRATSRATTPSRSTTSRCGPATRSRTGGACSSRRRPAPARRSSASSRSTSRSPPAARRSTRRRSRRCRTRSTTTWCARYGEDQVGLLTGDNTRQRRGARGRDDHRGAAQHAVRRVPDAARPRLRRDGRGALPRRPRPGGGVGGDHHPPARVGGAGLAVGDGVQRRGVRRVAGDRARRHHHHRRGAPAGAALPARHGRPAPARPVRRAPTSTRRPGS